MDRILNMLEAIRHECDKIERHIMTGKEKTIVAGFDAFWKAYPKKDEIIDAEKAWNLNVTAADVPLIMKALETARWPHEKRFIPAPHRWLRNKKWLEVSPNAGKYEGLSKTV